MAKKEVKASDSDNQEADPLDAAVSGVTLAPKTLTLTPGQTSQLTATVEPADATDKTVSFSSSDETKATVSAAGLVTAVAAGTVTLTVITTDGSLTDTATLTVEASPVVDLTLLVSDYFPANAMQAKSTVYTSIESLTLETDQVGKLVQTPEGFVFERIDLAVLQAPQTALNLQFGTDHSTLAEFTVDADATEVNRVDASNAKPGTFMPETWINITNQGDRPTGYGKLAISFIGYIVEPWR